MASRPPPEEHLDPRATTLWRLSGLLQIVPFVIAIVAGAVGLIWFDLLSTPIVVVVAAAIVLLLAIATWVIPGLVWKYWRYEIGEANVDIQHGWLTTTRTVIPMARIQHVDTRHGPLQRRFGLASVVLYTAAGASQIPALADEIATSARDRIAALANVHDDL